MSVLALAVSPGEAEFQMTNDGDDFGFFLFRKSMRNGKEHGNMAATALLGS
jgi:hypothetical protein